MIRTTGRLLNRSVLAALALLALAGPAVAQETGEAAAAEPQAFIADLGEQAIDLLKQDFESPAVRREEFHNLMRDSFDVDLIGRLVIGRYWGRATPTQRAEYQEIFPRYMLETILSRLSAVDDQAFQVTGTSEAGSRDLYVHSVVKAPEQDIGVDWRVRPAGEAGPKIIDVKIEGVSMVISNREEFSSVIQQNGIEGLLEALRKKTTHDDENDAGGPTEQASGSARNGFDGDRLGPPDSAAPQPVSAN